MKSEIEFENLVKHFCGYKEERKEIYGCSYFFSATHCSGWEIVITKISGVVRLFCMHRVRSGLNWGIKQN